MSLDALFVSTLPPDFKLGSAEDDVAGEEKAPERMSDPDQWGRYAWATIVGLACALPEDVLMRYWPAFADLLEHVLPCKGCRTGMSAFARRHPSRDLATRDAILEWLHELRQEVHVRNLLDDDLRLVDLCLKGYDAESPARWKAECARRFRFPDLYRHDVLAFLGCVVRAASLETARGAAIVREFLALLIHLCMRAGLPLDLTAPTASQVDSHAHALAWIGASPLAQRSGLLFMLDAAIPVGEHSPADHSPAEQPASAPPPVPMPISLPAITPTPAPAAVVSASASGAT